MPLICYEDIKDMYNNIKSNTLDCSSIHMNLCNNNDIKTMDMFRSKHVCSYHFFFYMFVRDASERILIPPIPAPVEWISNSCRLRQVSYQRHYWRLHQYRNYISEQLTLEFYC
ncbi:Hypothetical predicted protein [Octopus vulgaris]|uniref:Uncharacterized protein n=1 Tax=Octopus vulgaris TaxID=6645 RepID=A0AA36ANM2_OCTVU|nr:Hypothetical predicted protein [Octopus vulgaris]